MRLAFTGTQSTGKSTLIERFTRFPDQIALIREVARTVIGQGWPLGKRATVTSYSLYIAYQLELERAFEIDGRRHLLSDRCLIDLVAYGRANEAMVGDCFPPHFIDGIQQIAISSCRAYDAFVYFPIEFPQLDDGVRDSDKEYRQFVSEEIWNLLNELNLPVHKVSGTVDERYQQVCDLGLGL